MGKESSRRSKSKKSGLSPPKEVELKPEKEKQTSRSEDVVADNDIDKTQWENSRYKDEAKGIVVTDPNIVQREKVGEATPLLAESRQVMLSRGETLKKIPYVSLVLLALESFITVTVMICWAGNVELNETIPIIICFANLIIAILSIFIIFSIELFRYQVKKEKLGEDNFRFRIPYEWKYWLCMAHLLRVILTCANITIAALDDNFDTGVIVIVAVQPLIILLSAAHVFFAIRP